MAKSKAQIKTGVCQCGREDQLVFIFWRDAFLCEKCETVTGLVLAYGGTPEEIWEDALKSPEW